MSKLLDFIKKKEIAVNNNVIIPSTIMKNIEDCSAKKNISLAKSAEKLNAFQSLHIEDAIVMMTKPINNLAGESGLRFIGDGSVIFKNEGRWTGLTLGDSEAWLDGNYNKNHTVFFDNEYNIEKDTLFDDKTTINNESKKGLTLKLH